LKLPIKQEKSTSSTKAYVWSEIHSNRLEVGVVIPTDALDALSDGGLQRLIDGLTTELLQATLSYKTNEGEDVC
jgi:hypothetical protein